MERKYDKLFVGGDLSGIQSYLYNISSRKAAVSLKGRSAKLTEEMADAFDKIKKAIENKNGIVEPLYCSGGKFYLVTQNRPDVIESIDNCARNIKSRFWNDHMGQLAINVSYVAYAEVEGKFYVEGHEDKETKSGVLWKYVNADFARQKSQKFKELLLSDFDSFFNPEKGNLEITSKTKTCAITGIESTNCILLDKSKAYDEKNNFYVLPIVKEQINKGIELSKDSNGQIKDFEDYATTDDGAKGDTYLGILRMDVDGLGKRFIQGFDTLDAYKDFSNGVSSFFENDIEKKLLKEPTKTNGCYKKYLKIIYAGGDDLFIIGRWDKLIEFAYLIHERTLEKFDRAPYQWTDTDTGKSKHISISGGIAIVKPKFPIAKAAEMAGEAEEAAKQGEKNAFNMFGRTISWNLNNELKYPYKGEDAGKYEKNEFDYVRYFKDRFWHLIEDCNMSRSILHKIMLYSSIADMNNVRKQQDKPLDYSYVWHMSYFLTRFMERYKDNSEVFEFCNNLRDHHQTACKDRSLEFIALAARWCELLLRDKKKSYN